jgi:glutathione S-transferase
MKLFGTTTSPFVRRVRVVAAMLGVPVEGVDTRTEAGQAAMRAVNPTWKVPCAVLEDGTVLWDSRNIQAALVARHGWWSLRPVRDPVLENNRIHLVDAALEAAISRFYLRAEGVDLDAVPYLRKQAERVAVCTDALEADMDGVFFRGNEALGLAEIAWVCALDWFRFREVVPVDARPVLRRFVEHWDAVPAFAETRPMVGTLS